MDAMRSIKLKLESVSRGLMRETDQKTDVSEQGECPSPDLPSPTLARAKRFHSDGSIHESPLNLHDSQLKSSHIDKQAEDFSGEEDSDLDDVDYDEDDDEGERMWQISPVPSRAAEPEEGKAIHNDNLQKNKPSNETESDPDLENITSPSTAPVNRKESDCSDAAAGKSAMQVQETTCGTNETLKRTAPSVLQLPEEIWEEFVEIATRCWKTVCESPKIDSVKVFKEIGNRLGLLHLGPREDPDVAVSQLMKDIKRETVEVNDEIFVGGNSFDELYKALENILLSHNDSLAGTPLEHKVQRILRGCSRTVSGFDAYDVISALMCGATDPKALVTPAMMDNSPIRIEHTAGSNQLTLTSVNVFKISRELQDGSLATVVVLKTRVTEEIELDKWSTVRFMEIKPLDKAEECVNPMLLFRDRTLQLLLEQTKSLQGEENAMAFNKSLFEVVKDTKESVDKAIERTIKQIKLLAEAEYHRGYQDAIAKTSG